MTEASPHPLSIPGPSPLDEADPQSLDILLKERIGKIMNTRPSELTDLDLKVAVRYYRNKREIFMTEEARKIAEGPKEKKTGMAKAPKSVAEAIAATSIANIDDVF